MSWSANPTFTDGNVLSASQLNTLSDNLAFLYGRLQGVNVPFSSLKVVNKSLNSGNNGWTFRHMHNYLHYSLTLISGNIDDGDDLTIRRADTNAVLETVEDSPTELGTPQTWTGYINLGSVWAALDVGDYYTVYVTTDNNSESVFQVDYLIESDATSI